MDKSPMLIQQENLELKKENQGLQETVTKLLEEINRLQGIQRRPAIVSNVERIVQSVEEQIIEEQIMRLDVVSRQRALSLEETRALDLLIKNKRLLDPNKPIEPDYTKVPEGQTESDLLRIAGDVPAEPEKPRKVKSRAKTGSKDPVA